MDIKKIINKALTKKYITVCLVGVLCLYIGYFLFGWGIAYVYIKFDFADKICTKISHKLPLIGNGKVWVRTANTDLVRTWVMPRKGAKEYVIYGLRHKNEDVVFATLTGLKKSPYFESEFNAIKNITINIYLTSTYKLSEVANEILVAQIQTKKDTLILSQIVANLDDENTLRLKRRLLMLIDAIHANMLEVTDNQIRQIVTFVSSSDSELRTLAIEILLSSNLHTIDVYKAYEKFLSESADQNYWPEIINEMHGYESVVLLDQIKNIEELPASIQNGFFNYILSLKQIDHKYQNVFEGLLSQSECKRIGIAGLIKIDKTKNEKRISDAINNMPKDRSRDRLLKVYRGEGTLFK